MEASGGAGAGGDLGQGAARAVPLAVPVLLALLLAALLVCGQLQAQRSEPCLLRRHRGARAARRGAKAAWDGSDAETGDDEFGGEGDMMALREHPEPPPVPRRGTTGMSVV
jgi:hypothetical protein